ncbi:MAG: NYN domain-containing protein [Acidimicrobiia bacterium]|nr:NYN domain-containing protein [Acidimicrobiia bacterium]
MPQRVAVFIDYQNIYNLGREAFGEKNAAPWCGQFSPLMVANEIVKRREDSVLEKVHLYRGMPSSRKDAKGSAACSRQINAWSKLPKVRATWRPLRYPYDWPNEKAEEKGVDVNLAVDFLMGAVHDEYDVGVLFSGDSDMKPLLFAVEDLLSPDAIEVVAWNPPLPRYPVRVSLGGPPNRRPFCHFHRLHQAAAR